MKFLSYRSPSFPQGVVGLLDASERKVTPLLFPNGRPVSTLQLLIDDWDTVGERLLPARPEEEVASVEVLAPLRGRDVLCVGKNYKEHADEFHQSGYDSSDKKAQPDFPVIFTKRATSIVGHNATIYPHPKVTSSLDYEGELGVIIGKGGIGISKDDAWDHVWGACIINDASAFTARERQRDHKQFYIGKSLDTFCPMGPYAVPASFIDWSSMVLETKVNGETRQHQKTSELIFDIPTLIETCSMGITLQPGDVIATGTPAGVCLSNGKFLSPGDKIDITITGLGTLSNVIGEPTQPPPVYEKVPNSVAPSWNPSQNLVKVPSGELFVTVKDEAGPQAQSIIFIHGLGGWHNNYEPVVRKAELAKTHRIIYFDLEGLGLSPLTGSPVTVKTYAQSVKEVLDHIGVQKAIVVGHSMGGLIANTFAASHPEMVEKLFLIGPVKQLPEAGRKAMGDRAATVRKGGMSTVANTILGAGTSAFTQSSRPLSSGAVLASLLSSPSEGYARACEALGSALDPDYERITAPVFLLAGEEDKTCPKATVDFLATKLPQAKVQTLKDVGHWHQLEDVDATAAALKAFVQR